MTSPNLIQRGTQITFLSVLIGRCPLIANSGGGLNEHPANVGCSNFMDTNNDQSNYLTHGHKRKNGLTKAKIMYFTDISRAILHKEGIEKE